MVTKKSAIQSEELDLDGAAEALKQVQHTDDVVEYTLRCVLALAPGLSQALIEHADRQVREIWSGDRPYIAKRPGEGKSSRNASIKRDHQAGERLKLLARRYQLTERRILQIVAE
jgi:Mor family transcriptional regulator